MLEEFPQKGVLESGQSDDRENLKRDEVSIRYCIIGTLEIFLFILQELCI